MDVQFYVLCAASQARDVWSCPPYRALPRFSDSEGEEQQQHQQRQQQMTQAQAQKRGGAKRTGVQLLGSDRSDDDGEGAAAAKKKKVRRLYVRACWVSRHALFCLGLQVHLRRCTFA